MKLCIATNFEFIASVFINMYNSNTARLVCFALACVAALSERRACAKPLALPFLLVLPENKKSDWFKMKNMQIYAKIVID